MAEARDHKLDKRVRYPQDDPMYYIYNHDVDLKGNEIFITSIDRGYEVTEEGEEPGVDYVMASRFIRNTRTLMKHSGDSTPLLIHMMSCGGDWNFGMAIYDAIRAYPAKATILAYAHARSMSSIILQAANKRVLMPHCSFMFHMGTYGDYGTQKEVESNLEFFKRNHTTMVDIYAARMKERGLLSPHTLPYIRRWIKERMDKKENVWLSAKQAVDYGLADEIFDYNWEKLTFYDSQQDLR
jgi:ATP-dependent protease ClpP protease subunit